MVTQDKVVAKLDRILTLPDSKKIEIITICRSKLVLPLIVT